jgi:hypothetical protein
MIHFNKDSAVSRIGSRSGDLWLNQSATRLRNLRGDLYSFGTNGAYWGVSKCIDWFWKHTRHKKMAAGRRQDWRETDTEISILACTQRASGIVTAADARRQFRGTWHYKPARCMYSIWVRADVFIWTQRYLISTVPKVSPMYLCRRGNITHRHWIYLIECIYHRLYHRSHGLCLSIAHMIWNLPRHIARHVVVIQACREDSAQSIFGQRGFDLGGFGPYYGRKLLGYGVWWVARWGVEWIHDD